MNLTPNFKDYELIDSGEGEKLERFGRYTLRRPEPQAVWRKSLDEREWQRLADASFLRTDRSEERGEWRNKPQSQRGYFQILFHGIFIFMITYPQRHVSVICVN